MTDPVTEPVSEPVSEPVTSAAASQARQAGQPSQARSRYSMGSMPNMLRSLLVIMALVAGLVAIVPRVSEVRQPPVDAAAVAGYTVKSTGTPFLFPSEVPAGWVATNARYAASTDSLPTLQAGWTTPDGLYFSIAQTVGATPNWLALATNKGEDKGVVQVAGQPWTHRLDERRQPSLTRVDGTLTTVVMTTGTVEQLADFAAKLKPALPSG